MFLPFASKCDIFKYSSWNRLKTCYTHILPNLSYLSKMFSRKYLECIFLYYKEVLRTNPMSIHLVLVFIFASVLWPKIWTTHSNFSYTNKRKSSTICCPKIRSSVVSELCRVLSVQWMLETC